MWTEKILGMEANNADYEKLKDFISGDANRRFIHDGDVGKWLWMGRTSDRTH